MGLLDKLRNHYKHNTTTTTTTTSKQDHSPSSSPQPSSPLPTSSPQSTSSSSSRTKHRKSSKIKRKTISGLRLNLAQPTPETDLEDEPKSLSARPKSSRMSGGFSSLHSLSNLSFAFDEQFLSQIQEQEQVEYEERVHVLEERKKLMTEDMLRDIVQNEGIDQDKRNDETENGVVHEDKLNQRLEILVGDQSKWSSESSEVISFRDRMQKVRNQIQNKINSPSLKASTSQVSLPTYIVSEPFGENLTATSGGSKSSLLMFQVVFNNIKKTIQTERFATPDTFLNRVLEKFSTEQTKLNPAEYVLKAAGYVEFIEGDNYRLIDHEYIRQCVSEGAQKICVYLKRRQDVVMQLRDNIELTETISHNGDEKQELVETHESIALRLHDFQDLSYISLFDLRDRPFQLRMTEVENLDYHILKRCGLLPSPEKVFGKKKSQSMMGNLNENWNEEWREYKKKCNINQIIRNAKVTVFAVAQIYHGGEPIGVPHFTRSVPLSPSMYSLPWQQWLDFSDCVQFWQLPRSAKLVISVFARVKDTHSASTPSLPPLDVSANNSANEISSNTTSPAGTPRDSSAPSLGSEGNDRDSIDSLIESAEAEMDIRGSAGETTRDSLEQSRVHSQRMTASNSNRKSEKRVSGRMMKMSRHSMNLSDIKQLFTTNSFDDAPDLESSSPFSEHDIPIAWTSYQIIDHRGVLQTGPISKRLWLDEVANPLCGSLENPDRQAPRIWMEIPQFNLPVVMPREYPKFSDTELAAYLSKEKHQRKQIEAHIPFFERAAKILEAVETDSLFPYRYSPKEKLQRQLLWLYREDLLTSPEALPRVLCSVDWTDPFSVAHIRRLLRNSWVQVSPVAALELLSSSFPDEEVRRFGVLSLNEMKDGELEQYLLQLTQALRFENYHDSALARFLLLRAARSPGRIGHHLFWYLRSEMEHNVAMRERYGLLLEQYVRTIPNLEMLKLIKEVVTVEQLLGTALDVKHAVHRSERISILREELSSMSLPSEFRLPLDHRFEAKGFNPDQCRVMSSKKLPLWLSVKNADKEGKPLDVLFKAGDDLRQDILTLQILNIIDNLWKKHGLNLCLKPYKCVATGNSVGMLQIVPNSDTLANITNAAGGARAAFSKDPLKKWLQKHNPDESSFNQAVDNFIRSCAGYCVATYVLGIGDRHNDNVMVTKTGEFFHIDFGHFLGNFKKKFGVKRETTPFEFTPMYAEVMGGVDSEGFKKFEDTCCQAYNILRKEANLIINLFQLMLCTGIPELQRADDIMWIVICLHLELSDEEAALSFRRQIRRALSNKRTLINHYIHIKAKN